METFKILSLNYIEVTKQPELLTRPYQLTMDASIPETVARRMHGGGLITPNIIGDISGDILNPSAVGTQSAIDVNWMQQPRYAFILKVVSMSDYGVVYNYIHGYTNFDGISSNDGINAFADYDMVHYVTSVIETTPTPMKDGYGNTCEVEQLYRIYDVINDNSTEGVGLIRPSDIIDRISSNNLANRVESNFENYGGMIPAGMDTGMNDFGMHGGYDVNGMPLNIPKHEVTHMSNRISKFTEYAMISEGKNNNPNLYLTNVLNKGIKDSVANSWEHDTGVTQTEYGYETNYNSNYLEETELRKNAFLSYLSSMIIHDVAPRGIFTFNDLLKVDVEGANNFQMGYIMPDDVTHVLKQAPHIGGGEFWDGTGPVTVTAWAILQTALSIVSRGFGVMVLELTPNMIISGPEYNVGIINSWSYMNVNEHSKFVMMDMIKERIYHDIYMRHSKGGRIHLHAKIFININGDSKIYLEYGDAYGTWYTLPTVANAHVVPIVGKNENVIAETTNMFSNFIATITNRR